MRKKPVEPTQALTYEILESWSGLHLHPALVAVLARKEGLQADKVTTHAQLERLDAAIQDYDRQAALALAHGQLLPEETLEHAKTERNRLLQRLQHLEQAADVLRQEEQEVRTVVGQEVEGILQLTRYACVEQALAHLAALLAVLDQDAAIARLGQRLGRPLPGMADASFIQHLRRVQAHWQQMLL